MKVKTIGVVCLILLCGFLTPWMSEDNEDLLTGTWIGTWGTTPIHRMNVTVDLRWNGQTLSGVVHSGEQILKLENSTFDPGTSAVRLEIEVLGEGKTVRYIIDGTVDGRAMFGTWKHGDRKGNFTLVKI